MLITDASHLDNAELTAELSRLARCEREATAALIVHLAEFDARRLFEGAGYSSLFKYGMAVLHLSEDAVYNRIKAARAARRYPVIIERLESGALTPTTVRLLAPRLTRENHQGLLAAASGKGKKAVEELLACRFPQPDVAARVRKVPIRPVAEGPSSTPAAPTAGPPGGGMRTARGCASACARPWCRGVDRSAGDRGFAPAGPSARARPVRDPLHGQRGVARKAACRSGPARACHSQRRYRPGLRPRPDPSRRRFVEEEVRRHRATAPEPRPVGHVAKHPGGGAAACRRERRAPLPVRRPRRPAVRRTAVPGVPPRGPVCGRRQADGRKHPVAVSRAQRLRGRAVPRAGPASEARFRTRRTGRLQQTRERVRTGPGTSTRRDS